MSLLRIKLFGGLALFWDDQPLPPVPGAAARSLLAYLATYRERPHTRDLLAGTFWPDLPDATARRRLSQALWQIRRTLRPFETQDRQTQDNALSSHPVLLTESDTVQLNPELPLWIDVEQFTRRRAQGAGGGPEAQVVEHCEACVALYKGDFLAGYYDDWALVERERLREAFLGVLEQLVDTFKAQTDYDKALAYARQLASEDPLREEAHREAMRLYYLLGQSSEALGQYQLCRRALSDELGVEPSARTVALASEIAAQAGVAEVPHLPAAPRSSPLALLEQPDWIPLVDRQAERAELARRLELAAVESGGLVLLAGGAGVGKTRLMQEIARDAAWRGLGVLWGHSCELCAPPPYQPLVEMLHDADLSRLPAVWRRELGRLMPEQSPALALPALEPEQERSRLLEALARAFLALSQAAPHLLILEDLHWMDLASFEALRVLLPRLPASRLLMVGTLRPEELAGQPDVRQALGALEATRIPWRLELPPLTASDTGTLIRRALGLAQPAPRFSQRLYAGTEGNPFFVTETLRALVDEGLLYHDQEGEWCTPWDDATDDYAELPLPRSVAQGIERRLTRLSPAVRDLLGIAAVIGRQVEFDLWLAAGECGEGMTLAAAEELTRRDLLVEMDDVVGYRFAHDTIRQVVYEGLSQARRRQWHRRVAAALKVLHPDRVEALARNFRLGQDWPQAACYAFQAGKRAQAVYASRQALDHYAHADAWLAEGRVDWPGDEVLRWRADLAERQGRIYSLVGEYETANASLTRAWHTWTDLGDWRGAARVLNRLSFLCFVRDDYVGASRYAKQALSALPKDDPPADLWATSLTHLGLSAWTQGRYDEALLSLEKALPLFEEVGDDLYGLARCLNSLGLVQLELGDLDLAERHFARSLALRQQIGDRRGEAWCWHNQGRIALLRGDLSAAREKLETAQAMFADIQHPYGLENCARFLAEVEQAEAAARQARQARVRLPRADAPSGRPLRDDEYVSVSWTVAAPEDETVAGKVARRRQRLLRLLREAHEQDAAPTVNDLAVALKVSRPTIRRDLAALRQAGHAVQTRGSRGG